MFHAQHHKLTDPQGFANGQPQSAVRNVKDSDCALNAVRVDQNGWPTKVNSRRAFVPPWQAGHGALPAAT
jgi:hypothetical protein